METIEKRRWYRKLCSFFKIFGNQSPQYLFNVIPTSVRPYNTRNPITFLNIIRNIDRNLLKKNDLKVTETLLYGDSSLDETNNNLIMNATIEFLFASKKFYVPLV